MTELVETLIYQRPDSLQMVHTHYCPGCTHGVAHRLIAEVLDEMAIRPITIGVAPVGCSVFAYNYFNVDVAGRGENITVMFINNAIYGMTGGQMAPTTLPGQRTTSTPLGRDVEVHGMPLKMCEVLSQLDGSAYVVRRSLHDVPNIRRAKKAIRAAFEVQQKGLGFSMVELLSSCPTNWGLPPQESLDWIKDHMLPAFPLGDYKVHPALPVGRRDGVAADEG